MMSYLLLYLALFVLSASSNYTPVCDPAEFVLGNTHPPLPTDFIPDQFFYTVRADIVEYKSTYYLSEYFDGPGNRGRLETDSFGSEVIIIADYNLNEAFFLNSGTGECTVNSLATQSSSEGFSPTFIFGLVQGENGAIHVGSPSDFLLFNDASVRYLGNDTVNGVPCLRWQTCNVSDVNTSSYTIDYYFSDPSSGWSAAGSNDSVPVLIVLKGQDYNGTTGDTKEVEHYYSYSPFQGGPNVVPDEVFQIPTGTACKGRIPGQELPQFPSYFSATMEFVNATLSSNFKLFFDYKYQLVRFDSWSMTGPLTVIQDFNIGVFYVISKAYDNCTTQPLVYDDLSMAEATIDSNGQLHLQTARELLLASSDYNYSYQGVANVRGVEVDSWISLRDFEAISSSVNFTNIVYEIFFTRPGYVVTSDSSSTTEPAIWQINVQATINYIDSVSGEVNSTDFSAEYNVFNFSPEEPVLDVFESSLCLNPSQFVILNFAIVTNDTLTIPSVRAGVRDAVVKYAQTIKMPFVTPLQISAIQVLTDQSSYNVSMHISNLTDVTSSVWDYTAQSILDNITANVYTGAFLPFNITIAGKSYQTQFLSIGPLDACETCPLTLSTGETVGLAIAMFIAGWMFAIIFCIIFFVFWRHYRNKMDIPDKSFTATAVSYAKHHESENDPPEPNEEAD